jgi:predicted nucleic acid-binding protein
MVKQIPIAEWEKILLDTSIICHLFVAQNPETTDATALFSKKLIQFLSATKTSNRKERLFYISTITLSELLVRENDAEKIKRILRVLNASNVQFISFDFEVSMQFNKDLYPYLGTEKLHQFAKEFGFKTNDFMMAREWITRDFMIIESAKVNNVQVSLTADKRTFYPLANQIDCFAALCFPKLFDHSEHSILGYNHAEAQKIK